MAEKYQRHRQRFDLAVLHIAKIEPSNEHVVQDSSATDNRT
jgi:hypothetical protein